MNCEQSKEDIKFMISVLNALKVKGLELVSVGFEGVSDIFTKSNLRVRA